MPEQGKDAERDLDATREKIFLSIKNTADFLKKKKNWLVYLILAAIILFGFLIRIQNLWLLKDAVTGDYILQELDTYSFMRYAQYILDHGELMEIDYMRYVPLGKAMNEGFVFLSYFLAYFYKFFNFFDSSATLAKSTVFYPPIIFIPMMLAFYFLVKKLFNNSNKIALLSTAFLAVSPTFLYRTTAGFSDKETLATFFMFLAALFYILAFQTESKRYLAYGLLAGITTGLTGQVWGGAKFLIVIISLFSLIEFFLGRFGKRELYIFVSWLIPTIILMAFLTAKYGGIKFIFDPVGGGLVGLGVLFAVFIDWMLKTDRISKLIKTKDIPAQAASLLLMLILGALILSIIFGASYIPSLVNYTKSRLVHPAGTDRWVITVAENNQPYFTDWIGSFGFFFYFFFLGSILLFYNTIKEIKYHKFKFTALYVFFLCSFIFSRYSRNSSVFNGVTTTANIFYIGSLFLFIGVFAIFYLYTFYKNRNIFAGLTNLRKEPIFIFIWFFLMIVAARGAIRSFYILSPIAAILASYLIVNGFDFAFAQKDRIYKFSALALVIFVVFSPVSIAGYEGILIKQAKESYKSAKYMGPNYDQQWQYSMAWVRDNTRKDAVFAHWWDYGYWIQTGGQRATVLDGANSKTYWNYLMGRYVLTTSNETEALEFLKTHNATHLLIISDEIGKVGAYSSIGSDKNYDRYTWITSFTIDPNNPASIQEKRDETIYVYQGGYVLDEDFIYNGQVFPKQGAAIAAFLLPFIIIDNKTALKQPTAVIVYNGRQFNVPVKCVYVSNQEYIFGTDGLGGCLRLIPVFDRGGGENYGLEVDAGALYFSERSYKSLWAQLYAFNKKSDYFKLIFSDDEVLKTALPLSIFNGRTVGPIRIWEISYPPNTKTGEEFLYGELPDWFYNVY